MFLSENGKKHECRERCLTSCGPCPSCRWLWGSGPAGVELLFVSYRRSSGPLQEASSSPPELLSRQRGGALAAQNDSAAKTKNSKHLLPLNKLSFTFLIEQIYSFQPKLWTPGAKDISANIAEYLSLSLLQLSFFLLHPLHKNLPHLILSLLQLHQKLLSLDLIGLLQTMYRNKHTSTCQLEIMVVSWALWIVLHRWVGSSPDRFALWACVLKTHFFQFAAPIKLIMPCMSLLPQVLHVDTNEHLPQLHKVAVILILHWHTLKQISVLSFKLA